MFKLTVDKKEYKVRFYYGVFPNGDSLLNGIECKILSENAVVSGGISMQGPKDKFRKSTGRKIALMRALQIFPKEKRVVFWNEYFRLSPKDKR